MARDRIVCPLLLFALLVLVWASPGAAQPACSGFCNPTVPCDMTCSGPTSYTTCLQYNGVCNRDGDADGVDWVVDNCRSNYNPNQANCDGDSQGDVCDFLNGNFVATGNKIACASDLDYHSTHKTGEVKYQQRYVDTSSCNAADRWNHFTYDAYCPLWWGNQDCCAEACAEDEPGLECDVSICEPPGQYYCNPDTIPF